MAIALILGYLVAHEAQRLVVQQNLETAASKTAQGAELAVKGRERGTLRLSQDRAIVEAMVRRHQGEPIDETALLQLLHEESARSGDLASHYALYDGGGRFILGTDEPSVMDKFHPEWVVTIDKARLETFKTSPGGAGYTARVVAPIHHPESAAIIGFVSDDQQVYDLLSFVLEQGMHGADERMTSDIYEVVYITDLVAVTVYLEPNPEERTGPFSELQIEPRVDPKLAERLRNTGPQGSDSFSLWNYVSRDQSNDVLMAYHRLLPEQDLFIIVYRPRAQVFANINLAALLSFAVSVFVIATFCIIAYRNVHNNIIRAVSLLNDGAQIIRQGDYELKLKIGTGDEIEQLAQSFNEMASTLHRNITQLEESEEKYRSLITSMRDGIYQTDPDGHLIFMNPSGLEMLGLGRLEDAAGQALNELFISQADYDRVSDAFEQQGFIDRSRIWMRRRSTRERICVEVTANRVNDERGEIVGIEGTFRDVAQSVRLEQEARERSERIAAINQIANVINSSLEAGRVYESLVGELKKLLRFDYAAVSLREDDGSGFVSRRLYPEEQANAVITDEGGIVSAEWVSREGRTLLVGDLDTQPALRGALPGDIRSCVCTPLYANERIFGALVLGARKTEAFSSHAVEVVQQMAPHMAVAIRNAALLENLQQTLDAVTRAREDLHKANEELKTLDEMKTNLLSNVSHELRTPLVAVMGYTDMIINGKAGPVNDMQREYLNISLRNIEKLVTLIENLLDFSRLHRGKEEVVFDTLDLTDCARTSIQIVKPVADSREIIISLSAPDEPVLVEGDKGKLGQVFNNLLSNAVKFNRNGGVIDVELRALEGNVEVSVRDTGIGIPQEALDKVFTRFYQYDGSSTRKYGGTGIGLAIAQDIMRLHGSRIMVKSVEGEGANFYFTLPLSMPEKPDEGAASPVLPLPTETHLLIALITQDRALSNQVRNMLFSEGMDVIHAAYPAFAVGLANKYNPDLILIDTQAGPLGSVVLEEVIGEPSLSGLPMVLMTNDDALYERYKGQVSGRIKRGFRRSTLLSGIHYALSEGLEGEAPLGSKILTVDDDPEICMFIKRCLEPEGFTVEQCSSGEAAIEMVNTGEFGLVLLDIAMPGLDGWKTLEQFKQNPALQGLKVYMVTAKPIEKTMQEVKKFGADGYMLKPFKPDDLLALVQGFTPRPRQG